MLPPQPVEQLSRERPLSNIFNFYVLLSVLFQFALHIATLIYITQLSNQFEQYVLQKLSAPGFVANFFRLSIRRGSIDLDAKFEPSLLNTSIYLLGLSQQVSTFAINFQGRPFREGISENRALWWGLVGASAVAFSGATDFVPELNRWLQIVEMEKIVSSSRNPCRPTTCSQFSSFQFMIKLTSTMIIDFAGCYIIEIICKALFADLAPKSIVIKGRERREKRRAEEAKAAHANGTEKKIQ